MYTIKINNKEFKFEEKITLKELATKLNIRCYVAKVNNRLRELGYYINYDCDVEFLDLTDFNAVKVYETSLRYLTIMALERLYPNIKVKFNQCVSRSLACQVNGINEKVDEKFLLKLDNEMKKIVEADYPITRKKISKDEAYKLYNEKGYSDKTEVLKYRTEDYVNTYECDGYINYMFGYMVPSTSYLDLYKLRIYYPGFIIQCPRAECKGQIPPFEDSPNFGRMLTDAQLWAKRCDADTIAKINNHIKEVTAADFVNMCETKHNDMLADLGLKIKSDIENIRLIAIAGPSSSGKTTFSHRLRIELMARGIKAIKISMDDFYLDRDKAPLDEDGNPDLEHVEALDIQLFNKNLLALIQGEEVEMPIFDFKLGHRVKGYKLKLEPSQPLIIEGIHALNEKLTSLIPKHQKFKIYISPTTQINIDDHNPIVATEVRLLRRIVRDAQFRKTSPISTLAMWSSVRRGEFKWIYPFQENADYIFNTELTYELCVMKKYALTALEAVDKNSEYYIQANRLVKFLKYFMDIDDKYVPCNSLLREFIGSSCFYE